MSYRTFVTLGVVEFDTTQKNEAPSAQEAMKALVEAADPSSCEYLEEDTEISFEDNWSKTLEHIVELSRRNPGLLLEAEVDGSYEDSDDRRNMRIRNGQTELYTAEVTYAHFKKLITAEEKEALCRSNAVCYGRKDLLEVARTMASDYGNESVAEELAGVMTEAALRFLIEVQSS